MLRMHADGVVLAIRCQPNAKKTAATGVFGEGETAQLKVSLHAPPLDGRANAELTRYLAASFRISKRDIELLSGESSRSKLILLRAVELARAHAVIEELMSR